MLAHEITFIVLWKLFVKGIALTFSTWSLHVFLELLKRLFFASAAGRRVGQGAKCLQRGKITLSLRKLANKAMRIPQNLLRVYNMLTKLIIITIICHHHRHHHITFHQAGIRVMIFHRKISRRSEIIHDATLHIHEAIVFCKITFPGNYYLFLPG